YHFPIFECVLLAQDIEIVAIGAGHLCREWNAATSSDARREMRRQDGAQMSFSLAPHDTAFVEGVRQGFDIAGLTETGAENLNAENIDAIHRKLMGAFLNRPGGLIRYQRDRAGGMNLLFCGIIEDGHRIFNEFHAQAPELVDSRKGGPWRNRPIGITIERAIVRQRLAQSLKKTSIASGIVRDLDLEI